MHDLQINNARLWPGDGDRLSPTSLGIRGGRIVGFDQSASRDVVTIDAGGRPVLPGFIDAHLHLTLGSNMLMQLDLSRVRSRDEFEAAIADQHAAVPGDTWLIGHGWAEDKWSGGMLPDRSWLAGARDRPCVCYRYDQHAAVVNEAVLRLIHAEPEPEGGRIVRDGKGEPTGLLVESALWTLVNPLIPEPDVSTQQEALFNAQAMMHAAGITAVGSMEYADALHNVIEPVRDRLTLRVRATLLDRTMPLEASFADAFAGDDHLAIIGFKSFLDGTLGSRTARMLAPYADDPDNKGLWLEHAADETLQAWARSVVDAGYSPSMHAIGDAAVRKALDIVDRHPAAHVRIEHAQHVDPEDVSRCSGRVLSMQPLHVSDDASAARSRLGLDRVNRFFPFRSLVRAGALLAFGSDWPVVSFDPIQGMRCSITGLDKNGDRVLADQTLPVEHVLRAYTSGAAHALQMPHVGRLEPGAAADLVMLDRDPFDADWENELPRVELTIAGGLIVYDGIMQGVS